MDLARADEVTCHLSRESPPFPVSHWLDWSALVDKHPTCLRPSMPADRIMTIFQSLGLRYALLCSPRGRLMGIIKKKDLLAFLARHNIHHK
jgi:CBS-domain-containing membrane protein